MHGSPPLSEALKSGTVSAPAGLTGEAGGLPGYGRPDQQPLASKDRRLESDDLAALSESAASLSSILAEHVRAGETNVTSSSLSSEEIARLSRAVEVLSSLLSRQFKQAEGITPTNSPSPRRSSLFLEALSVLASSGGSPESDLTSRPAARGMTSLETEQLIEAYLSKTVQRLPVKDQKCPFSGMKRGQLYELFKRQQNGKPVIRHASLREEGEKHGAHFYKAIDVVRYLEKRIDEQGAKEVPKT